MEIRVPEVSLIALVGASGSVKSSFARTHFLPTEVISSDFCIGLVADNQNDLAATKDAFDLLYYIARKRLASGRLTVIDATNVQQEDRRKLVNLVREHDYLATAIVFDMPEALCHERNGSRPDRDFGRHVVARQRRALKRSLRRLKREGFRHVYTMTSEEQAAAAAITRTKLWTDLKDEKGPFDLVGDVHGCIDELRELLVKLGYTIENETVVPPEGRKLVFLGDLVDRGPDSPAVLRLAMKSVAAGHALCVPGNHDMKLLKKLNGKDVQLTHGLAETMAQLGETPPEFHEEVRAFVNGLVSHYVLDDGKLVVAHAGMLEQYQGRASGRVRSFALYGETTGESDEYGLPIRFNWAADYRGSAMVAYGHTPVPEPDWLNRTINIDTGCVFGGKLTALRYPEMELISVEAARVYAEPLRPLHTAMPVETDGRGDILDISDVSGKRVVHTALRGNVTVREGHATAALEVMSRFAIDPHWLVYLPPTMSPSETTSVDGLLEHPGEVFSYFQKAGIEEVICEEKHMGSRVVVIVCRDADTALKRFGVKDGSSGACYTRTGRAFFNDKAIEDALIDRVKQAVSDMNYWESLETDWLCLDCELMPWSAKAQALLKDQYAATGIAATVSLQHTQQALEAAVSRGIDVATTLERTTARQEMVSQYRQAYRHYCWPVQGLAELKLAPFHLLASEGQVHTDKDHVWHMEMAQALCDSDKKRHGGDSVITDTPHRVVSLSDEKSVEAAVTWWAELTASGGEGMVVKPKKFYQKGKKGLIQPALKCRGREYLRIIYGPEYTAADQLERLRSRGLNRKRSLALREFALGIEALERFVQHDALYRVHECVFGVLALESEPVDPRL
jgi:protein phosphatase